MSITLVSRRYFYPKNNESMAAIVRRLSREQAGYPCHRVRDSDANHQTQILSVL